MIEAEYDAGTYWKKCGDEALPHGIKGIIIMALTKISIIQAMSSSNSTSKGAHWECLGNSIEVATNPSPSKGFCPYVNPATYTNWIPNPDIPTARRCIDMLAANGFNVFENKTFEWIHDTFLILARMFPDSSSCPPTTIVSMNARFDPYFHVTIGAALRQLREENHLIIGSGGAVHNLYRNVWQPMVLYRDTLGQESPSENWALDFRQAAEDVITRNSGPNLRRAMIRLIKHPQYRDTHAADDYFMPALFCAGAAGDWDDRGTSNVLGSETWELTNMCSSQYTLGRYSVAAK